MSDFDTVQGMAAAWDRASAEYLSRRDDAVDEVTYGALAPGEWELHLLGDMRGRAVVDFGGGGGHNSVAYALAGAEVTCIDISAAQLAHAVQLADGCGVSLRLLHGGAEQLARVGRVEVILAIHVFSYIAALEETMAACRAALVDGGRLVVAVDHPLRHCFWDEEAEDLGPVAVRRYDDETPMRWQFDGATPMQSFPRTTASLIEVATRVGLRLVRLVEPLVPKDVRDELWPEDSPLAPLREIPHTLILVFATE